MGAVIVPVTIVLRLQGLDYKAGTSLDTISDQIFNPYLGLELLVSRTGTYSACPETLTMGQKNKNAPRKIQGLAESLGNLVGNLFQMWSVTFSKGIRLPF